MAEMKPKLVVINSKDMVATAIEQLEAGTEVCLNYQEQPLIIKLLSNISFGHKVALRDIKKGETIVKYGESIGVATQDIARGEHAHTQNVESCRGRGDKG
jgi:altronate dehydratase small subunit